MVEETVDSKDLRRIRLDTGKDIFTQLTSVFDELASPVKARSDGSETACISNEGDTTIVHLSDPVEEAKGEIICPIYPNFAWHHCMLL